MFVSSGVPYVIEDILMIYACNYSPIVTANPVNLGSSYGSLLKLLNELMAAGRRDTKSKLSNLDMAGATEPTCTPLTTRARETVSIIMFAILTMISVVKLVLHIGTTHWAMIPSMIMATCKHSLNYGE